jgi:hypothetical protein
MLDDGERIGKVPGGIGCILTLGIDVATKDPLASGDNGAGITTGVEDVRGRILQNMERYANRDWLRGAGNAVCAGHCVYTGRFA